ncbi:hypothetical protein B0T16DRAFT_434242 [Cercophora newfieldiana]|uniref:DUF6594 domain-containing protein n=1 Tax=Cercophora newfieldiana TaxID=92897 RepID=A0AA39YSI3_9PEZI|nr:hypothetical protein B0T16DRAFT_434242 [Cercophora newfieldiana]
MPSQPLEKGAYVDGFPSLAAFMASDWDKTAMIFKRFDRLAARNLLCLQSELAELEAQLDQYDREDQENLQTMQYLRNWKAYKERGETERMELMARLRSTMREYREALIFESTLAQIKQPDRKTLKAFRFNFFHGRPGDPQAFPMMGGHSATVYDDDNDLVALHSDEQSDRLTVFVRDNFGFLFQEKAPAGGSSVPLVGYASGQRIANFIAYLSTIFAGLLLFGAILVLHKVKADGLKLGLIGLFTFLFAASTGLMTNAKRPEVFASTAAYAAVLVVFVSGDLGASGQVAHEPATP